MTTSQDSASPMVTSSPTPTQTASFSYTSLTTANTPTTISLSLHRRSHPYFSKRQQAALTSLKNDQIAAQKENAARAQSCKFMENVGKKMGLYPFIASSSRMWHTLGQSLASLTRSIVWILTAHNAPSVLLKPSTIASTSSTLSRTIHQPYVSYILFPFASVPSLTLPHLPNVLILGYKYRMSFCGL